MRRRIRNPLILKVKRYADRFIYPNKYLDVLPREKLSGKFGATEINRNLLNSMPNSWINKVYVYIFESEYVAFKKAVNMFKRM